MAVLISLDEFENLQKQRKTDMTIFDKIRSKKYSSASIKKDVEEVMKAVRKGV